MQNFAGKIFLGYIVDKKDPAGLNRKAVYIPDLLKSVIPGEKYVFCKEAINTFVRTRDPLKSNYPYISYGSHQPLLPGTKVLVAFINNNLESGYIIGIDAVVKEAFAPKEWIIYRTPEGSEFYVNDENGVCHIKNAQGMTNIYLTKDDIYLQINDIDPEGKSADDLIAQTYIQLGREAIVFKVGNTTYRFGNNGLIVNTGEDSATFLEMTKDTININAAKTVNISSEEGNVNLSGQYTYVTGYNELHLYGNDTRLTGAQKAQVSGTTVAMWGWIDAHVKGMHVGIDAWISYDLFTTVKNELNLALENVYSSITAKSSGVDVLATGIKAENYSIKAQDGIVVSNLGIGSGVSSSVTASMNTVTNTLKLSLMTINTGLLMSDPFTGAVNQVLTMSIAGSANQALGGIDPIGENLSNLDKKNSVVTAVRMREEIEENGKKYILPDELSI